MFQTMSCLLHGHRRCKTCLSPSLPGSPHACLVHVPFVDKLPSPLFFQIKVSPPTHLPKEAVWGHCSLSQSAGCTQWNGEDRTRRKRRKVPGGFPRGYVPLLWFSPVFTLQIRNTLNEPHTDQGQVSGNGSTLPP